MRIQGWLLAMVLLVFAGQGIARNSDVPIEASMVVTGHVDIEADGSVSGHSLDQRDKLPDFVAALIDGQAPRWRFEPHEVDGTPVAARAKMSLRVVAEPIAGGDEFALRIASAHFGAQDAEASEAGARLRRDRMARPKYPDHLLARGVEGVTYLVLKIGRDGKVEDLVVERVNLKGRSTEIDMRDMRRLFALASRRAARNWTFHVPTTGPDADRDHWLVRVPVSYTLDSSPSVGPGEWDAYVRGPREPMPDWIEVSRSSDNDALLAGGMQMLGASERRLLTPLQEG